MARGRILVIEEDRFYVEFYRDILEKEGFKVETAKTASEVARRIQHEPYDLVITDVLLKGLSGLEILSLIKKTDPTKDVIMVTGMQSIRQAVEALKMGASDYLTKPVDAEELLLAVNKILERQVISQEHVKLISENIHFYDLLRIQKKNYSFLPITDEERLMELVLDVLIQEMNAPGALFFRREGEAPELKRAALRGMMDRDELAALELNSTTLLESLEAGRPIMESADGSQWVPKGDDEGYRMLIPVRGPQRFIGAVRLASRRTGRLYTHFDLDLGRNVLEAAGVALENAARVKAIAARHIAAEVPGTYSPEYFRAFADGMLSVSRRYNREASLVLMDLANLGAIRSQVKEIQVQGVIAQFCKTVLDIIRETDVLAQIGPSLFGVIVPETDYYGALMLIKRLKIIMARTVYSLDLKREVPPVVYFGCSAAPRDGTYYPAIHSMAAGRMADDAHSLVRSMGLDRKEFWATVELLHEPGVYARLAEVNPLRVRALQPVSLTEGEFQELAHCMVRDLQTFCSSRGLLYLGVGTVDPSSPVFVGTTPPDNFKLSMFALGAKGDHAWNLAYVTPVFINDEALARHLFILGLAEDFSYALFCRRDGEGGLSGFHTSDHLMVLELVGRLQDQYLLQRRIG